MNKKGFTLVELLATIVILTILSLITIPLVLGIVDKAKQASFEDSVKISSRQVEMYLFENGLSEIPSDGIKVKNMDLKSDFISGTFKNEDGKIVADKIRNKEFCASGPINRLVIRKDCDELDTTAPVIDESKLVLSKTSNSVTVNILDGFAIEEESYIKNYIVNIYDNNQKIDSKTIDDIGTVKFSGLTSNKEYKIEVIATNSNDLTASATKTITTTEIETPTYTVTPSGWAQSKTVTIKYPSGYTNEYSLDGGLTWEKYTTAILFTNNGSVIARVTDGVNTTSAAAQAVTQIDTTAPTAATFAYTKTSNSIAVTASGTDNESGVTYYQFSKDNGKTWTPVQTSNKYTFSGLKTDSYDVKVKVINDTYASTKTINTNNSLDSATQTITTTAITTPTYSVTPSGWAQSKTVTITYAAGYTNEYSTDGGSTWKAYTSALTFNANGSVIARTSDGTNTVTASSQSVTQIDTTKPTAATFTYTKTSNSIVVTASGTDNESGITHYQFSKDNGTTWTAIQTSNTYTFSSLKTGTYTIIIKAINGTYANVKAVNVNNSLNSAAQSISTTAITMPIYAVSPSGWAQSKTVAITYPNGYTNEYSLDGGSTWKKYTSALTFNANGSVIARSSDGTNTVTASSQAVTQIDTTAPTAASFTTTNTSNSITVTATGTDNESGITHYQFSKDNGTTWTAIQTSNKYTFSSLAAGSYNVKVKVINGTYANVKAINANNSLDSSAKLVSTTAIATPTYSVTPSGWAQSKTVTITYPSGYTNEYSLDGGSTWKKYTSALTFNANGSVIARINDGVNTVTAASQAVTQIDTTAPTAATFTYTKTSNSIKVTAKGVDDESGISNYQFSKDNGTTWTDMQASGIYTFDNLTAGTYSIKVKVINGTYANVKAVNANNSLESDSQAISTVEITKPTYTVTPSGWAQSKTVTIAYPSGYTNQYSTDGGKTWTTYSKALTFNANGSVIARSSDGTNTITAASQSVTQIDTTAPTAASFTTTNTSNSITVTASGTDNESGITHYQFSKDNGTTWTTIQTSNKYTFSSLKTGSYSIKVKVINGTYANVKAANANNSLDSTSKSVSTTAITTPTYSVTPSGWAQSKTVTITYAAGYTNEYSIDSGKTWTTYSKALTFSANGSVIARSSDGTNTVTASSQAVTGVDTTKPTAASFTYTRTSKSITVTASGTDSESGITHYQFSSDNGSTWTAVQTSNIYTFNSLKTGTYSIKVKVINGTYANVKAVNANNSLDSSAQSVATTTIATPTYSVTPSGWAQSKTVTITYASGYTNQYSTDSGKTWTTYSKALTFNANGSVIARSSDGTNTVTASSQSITQIDTTKPTAASFTTTKTSNSITVTASGTDSESGITHYQFSKDNGTTWTTIQTSNKYTFSGLTTGAYNIKVKVINGTYANVKAVNANNSLDSSSESIATTAISTPTYTVAPSGWAQSKTVTIAYPSGYTNQYSTDGGKTWTTYSKALTFSANGSVIARSSDGTNTVTAASQAITQIDTTKPTAASFTTTNTSNSITVTATGTDSESGITHYQFSKDNGSTWTTIQTSNKYTFSGLTTGAYNIKVKVINGTYANVKAVNANNSLDSTSKSVSTTAITTPTYSVTPSGWAQSKTVTINYASGYTNQYSTDGGKTWTTYSKALTFSANGSVIARSSDGTNTVTASSQSVTQIDTTKPTAASFTYTRTSKSITVTASGTDSESGITHYQFSKDNGSTWTAVQTSNIYTFNSLKTGTYSIKVKVINGTYANVKAVNANNSLDSSAQSVATTTIATPTYSVTPSGWAQSKTVTITYGSGYTNQYSTDGGKTWTTYSKALTFSANGSVIARSSDGTNTVTASSQSITQIDTTKPTAASFTTTNTSNSITVTAAGTDNESGITHYQFSKDNGSTWTAVQTSNKYTFSSLKTGSYTIMVKVINGTYANVKAANANNSLNSTSKAVSTTAITTPIYAVSPTGWAQSKTVTITYPSGYTNQYSLDGGKTWTTYSKALTFSANGSVIARTSDGTNTVTASSQSVTGIDTTKPTAASFTSTKTSNSITVTASGTDGESGITHYQFSKDNGTTWTAVQTSNKYTFSSLKTGTYSIKVKVINGTYANVKAVNANNSLDSAATTVTTTTIATPTYSVTPSGWAQSKTVTITYGSGYTNQYSLDGGKTWTTYSKALTFSANGSVIARSSDGTNTVTASSQSVTQIDTTKPTAASFTYTRTSKSITVTASGTDNESGITHYQFSKDNGTTWSTIQTGKSYTFNDLATGTYSIKVKVINGTYANVKAVNANNSLDSAVQSVATVEIAAPTYSVTNASTWALSKTVTITYPSGYTNQYSLDGGTTWKSYTAPIVLTDLGSTSATVIARVTDGKNYKTGSSLTVSNIYLTSADKVTFTPSDSNWKVTTVHEALEYLRNN